MWIQNDIMKLAEEILAAGQGLLDRLKELRPLTGERPDYSGSMDVTVLQMEVRLLRQQRETVSREVVALGVDVMGLRAELMKLRGFVAAGVNVGAIPRGEAGRSAHAPLYADGKAAAAHDDSLILTMEGTEND